MRTTLVSLAFAAGICLLCCQSAGAVSAGATITNERAIASQTQQRMAWTMGSTKGTANTARRQKGSKAKP